MLETRAPEGRRRTGVVVGSGLLVVLLATALAVVVGAGLRMPCVVNPPAPPPATGSYGCYNDIQSIWSTRDVGAHETVYTGPIEKIYGSDGELKKIKLGAGQIEYPLLTGVFVWFTGLLVSSKGAFLAVSMLFLAPFAFLAAFALQRLSGRRALLFALAPPLAMYSFYNWDLLPVSATACALLAWRKDRVVLASVLLALGAAAKIWPGFLLLPLFLALLLARRWRDAALVVVAPAVTLVTIHLPWLLTDWRGLLGPYLIQSLRTNDRTTNSIWYLLFPDASLSAVNLASGAAVGLVWLAVLVLAVLRRHEPDGFPLIAVAGAMVAAYMVLSRVDSPQYAIWLTPFLVLLRVRWYWLAAFFAAEFWLYLEWTWLYVGRQTAGTTGAAWSVIIVLLGLVVVLARASASSPVLAGREQRTAS